MSSSLQPRPPRAPCCWLLILGTHQRESRLEHLQVIVSIHLWLENEQEMMTGPQMR